MDSAIASKAIENPVANLNEGNRLAAILLGVLIFFILKPPGFQFAIEILRWYVLLAVALIIFCCQGLTLRISASKVYLTVSGLALVGACLSLFRTPKFDVAIWQTMGSFNNYFIGLLILPTLATFRGRQMFLRGLLLAAIVWGVFTLRLYSQIGSSIRYELDRNLNHNFLGLVLALAATTLFLLFINTWDNIKKSIIPISVKRLYLLFGVLFLFSGVIISYSRSSLLTAILGIMAVLYLKKWLRHHLGVAVCIGIFSVFLGSILLTTFIKENPRWLEQLDQFQDPTGPTSTLRGRVFLVQKALSIIAANPFIGVGMNVFREASEEEGSALKSSTRENAHIAHNTYLGAWAELGILGLISHLLFWLYWVREYKIVPLESRPDSDQALLMLFPPFFFMQFFLDAGTLSWLMLLVLAGLYYERMIYEKVEINKRYDSSKI